MIPLRSFEVAPTASYGRCPHRQQLTERGVCRRCHLTADFLSALRQRRRESAEFNLCLDLVQVATSYAQGQIAGPLGALRA